MRENLTARFADTVKPTPGKIARYFDTTPKSPRGFLLRITPAGARAWALRYRVKETGREREITIGDCTSWPISEARKRAHELRRDIDVGGDPLANMEEKRAAPTVAQLVDRFVKEALPSRADSTAAEYRAMLDQWILPAIGTMKVAAVTSSDIEKLHRKISAEGKMRRANAVKSLCSGLFRQAITWEYRADNPATGIKGNAELGRERYLTSEEIERLMAAIERWRARCPDSCDMITMALLTGARRGELLYMRWPEIDLETGVWTKPAASTKQRKGHRIPLGPEAMELLRRRQAEHIVVSIRGVERDRVFAGLREHAQERQWDMIRAAAGLEDCRFHDLRHAFASLLVSRGVGLPTIGKMLGHSMAQTTMRYAHLSDVPLREAAAIVGAAIVGGGKGAPK